MNFDIENCFFQKNNLLDFAPYTFLIEKVKLFDDPLQMDRQFVGPSDNRKRGFLLDGICVFQYIWIIVIESNFPLPLSIYPAFRISSIYPKVPKCCSYLNNPKTIRQI